MVIGEIDRNESNPFYFLNREMNERSSINIRAARCRSASPDRSQASTALMRTIQQRYYVPNIRARPDGRCRAG